MTEEEQPLDGECYFCGQKTCSYAGNPGRWPLRFSAPDGTGKVRFFHTECVARRLWPEEKQP